jgi:subtilisin family serine protease
VAATGWGTFVVSSSGDYRQGNGTSFSSPLIAGMMATLWQAHPEATPKELMDAVKRSASSYFSPNDSIGYGIPDFHVADLILSGVPESLVEPGKLPRAYPNPFRDQVNILYFSENDKAVRLVVTDPLGRIVFDIQSDQVLEKYYYFELDFLDNQPTGLYQATFWQGGKRRNLKLLRF